VFSGLACIWNTILAIAAEPLLITVVIDLLLTVCVVICFEFLRRLDMD
jgi:hypothetical protein